MYKSMKIKKLRSILALLILLIFQSVFAQVNTKQFINSICDSLSRHYIFPDKALQIASYLHKEAQIEFINDENDQYSTIKIYVYDGSVFEEMNINK